MSKMVMMIRMTKIVIMIINTTEDNAGAVDGDVVGNLLLLLLMLLLLLRCQGTLVACQYAGAGCDQRGPARKMREHQTDCSFKKEGRR